MKIVRLFIMLAMLIGISLNAGAQDKKKTKQKNASGTTVIYTTADTYVFGIATNIGDSVVYMTEIQKLPQVEIEVRTGSLKGRSEYSIQLKQFLEYEKHQINQTCAILCFDNQAKAQKAFTKCSKKQLALGGTQIIRIAATEFSFKKYEMPEQEEQTTK